MKCNFSDLDPDDESYKECITTKCHFWREDKNFCVFTQQDAKNIFQDSLKKFCAEMLLLSTEDYFRNGGNNNMLKHRVSAEEWIRDKEENEKFTLHWCCIVLKLSPDVIRNGILNKKERSLQ